MNIFNDKGYILFDGGFGTYYNKITNKFSSCELANIEDSKTVCDIHQEYIDSGAQAIKTNTFGANTASLGDNFNLVYEVIKRGWEIGKSAIGNRNILEFADIGPIFQGEDSEKLSEYKKIIDVFIKLGAKHFLFETFPDHEVLKELSSYIKGISKDSFIITSFAVDQEGYTRKGAFYKDIFSQLYENKNVDGFGLNCICGPSHMSELLSHADVRKYNISAMPNAGYPTNAGGRTIYVDNAEYFAEKLVLLADMGVKILGGCCGTTPAHIKAFSKEYGKKHTKITDINYESFHKPKGDETADIKGENEGLQNNQLEDKFSLCIGQGKGKVIAVELAPPPDTNYGGLEDSAKAVKAAGADALTVPDSPLARPRADSIIVAAKLQRDLDLPAIPHLSCRDRNFIGFKASLLGASMENVNNIFVITGDPAVQTGRSEDKGVFLMNSFELIKYISNLNENVFNENKMFIGGALNVNVSNFNNELKRAKLKESNGAGFLMTQPVFGDKAIENLKLARKELNIKILAGIMPLAGYKNAVFINNEVPGINIPEEFIESFKDKSKEESEQISIEFCMGIINKISSYCDGYYLITPLKRTGMICELIKQIRSEGK